MTVIIVCVLIVALISIVSEVRIMRLEKIHNDYVKEAREKNRKMYEVGQEALHYLDATWSVLIDRMEEGEDIELIIEEKRTELILEELENE